MRLWCYLWFSRSTRPFMDFMSIMSIEVARVWRRTTCEHGRHVFWDCYRFEIDIVGVLGFMIWYESVRIHHSCIMSMYMIHSRMYMTFSTYEVRYRVWYGLLVFDPLDLGGDARGTGSSSIWDGGWSLLCRGVGEHPATLTYTEKSNVEEYDPECRPVTQYLRGLGMHSYGHDDPYGYLENRLYLYRIVGWHIHIG